MTPTNLNLNKFYLQCSCHGAQCLQYQHRKLNKSKLWPLQCLVNSSPLMSSKRFFFPVLCGSSKVWTGITYTLRICWEFLSSQLSLGIKGCCFPAEKSADPWKLQLTHLLNVEIMPLGGFLLHLKTLLPYPPAKAYFLRRSAVHLLEELTFWLLPHAPLCKEAFEHSWGDLQLCTAEGKLDLQLVLEWWWCRAD